MPHIGLEWEAIEVCCWQQNFCPELYLLQTSGQYDFIHHIVTSKKSASQVIHGISRFQLFQITFTTQLDFIRDSLL